MKRVFVVIPAIALLWTLSGITGVSAQEESGTKEDLFMLEEVTVTATKVSENQQKVDIPMEVITGQSLKEMGRTNLDDILANSAGAVIARYEDGLRVTLRGISDDVRSHYDMSVSAPTVAVNVDGIRSNRKDKGSSLFDMERVEVLYGPQSTLYSSNSPGGIVNIVTAKPKLDTFAASGTLEIGNYSLMRTEGMMNVPVSGTVAMRAAFTTEARDGYFSNGADDADNKAMRFRTLYQPTDNFYALLTASKKRSDGSGNVSTVKAFDKQDDVDDPWETATSNTTDPGSRHETSEEFSAEANWVTKLGTVTLISNYSEGTADSAITEEDRGLFVYHHDGDEKGAEIRMASNPDFFLQWIAGVNYYTQYDSVIQDATDTGEFADKQMDETAKAVFANITYPITDQWRLLGGIRYSEDEMDIVNIEGKPSDYPDEYGNTVIELTDERKNVSYSRPDYKFGFEYDLGSQSMLYGNYSTSYRVNGWSGAPTRLVVIPELLTAYTLGSKNRFLSNKLQVNAAAYYYDYENYTYRERREPWFDYNGDGIATSNEKPREPNQQGIGDGTIWGIDLQISAIITPKDILNISWAHIDSAWDNLSYDFKYNETDMLDENGNVVRVTYPDLDYEGKPMSNSPPDTFTLNYLHNFILPNGASLKANITGRYQTKYRLYWGQNTAYRPDGAYPMCEQEAYHMSDASLAYTDPNDKWTLSLWVKNIENYAVKRMFWEGEPPDLDYELAIGPPRTLGATLTMNF